MRPKLLLAADTYYPKVDGTLKFMEEFLKRTKNDFEISLLVPFLGERRGEKVTYLEPSGIFSVSGFPRLKLSFSYFHKIRTAIWQGGSVFLLGAGPRRSFIIFFSPQFY